MGRTRMLGSRGDGPPVYTYEAVPGVPPVSVRRLGREPPDGSPDRPQGGRANRHTHSHDFLLLFYFERDGGSLRLGERERTVESGDAYVIAPGEVVGIGEDVDGLVRVEGWTVFFSPEVLGSQAPGAFLSWRPSAALPVRPGRSRRRPTLEGATRGADLLVRALRGPRRGAQPET